MRETDFAWLVENGVQLQKKYAGKWIAVRDGKIVGVGATAVEADEEARRTCTEGDYILEAVEEITDAINGQF